MTNMIDRKIKRKELKSNIKILELKTKKLVKSVRISTWDSNFIIESQYRDVDRYTLLMIEDILKIRQCYGLNNNFIDFIKLLEKKTNVEKSISTWRENNENNL